MNKTLAYVVIAIILGLAMTLTPTWLFFAKADQRGERREGWWSVQTLPDYSGQNHVETVSSKEVEVLGISFVVASIVYFLFKRKTPTRIYTWHPIPPY